MKRSAILFVIFACSCAVVCSQRQSAGTRTTAGTRTAHSRTSGPVRPTANGVPNAVWEGALTSAGVVTNITGVTHAIYYDRFWLNNYANQAAFISDFTTQATKVINAGQKFSWGIFVCYPGKSGNAMGFVGTVGGDGTFYPDETQASYTATVESCYAAACAVLSPSQYAFNDVRTCGTFGEGDNNYPTDWPTAYQMSWSTEKALIDYMVTTSPNTVVVMTANDSDGGVEALHEAYDNYNATHPGGVGWRRDSWARYTSEPSGYGQFGSLTPTSLNYMNSMALGVFEFYGNPEYTGFPQLAKAGLSRVAGTGKIICGDYNVTYNGVGITSYTSMLQQDQADYLSLASG